MAGKKKKGSKKKVHNKHQKNLHKDATKTDIDKKLKIATDEKNNSETAVNESNQQVFKNITISDGAKLTMTGGATLLQSATIKNSDGVVISHGLDVYDSCVQVVGDELVVTPME